MKLRTKLILITAVICACTTVNAEKFDNWPTYASSPLTNWPKASEYDKLVEDFAWCHNALVERSLVVGASTTGSAPLENGVRLPKLDMARFKSQIKVLIPDYVDDNQAGSFTNQSEFPMLTKTEVLTVVSLPEDFLDSTPYSRYLDNTLLPGISTNYGMPGINNTIHALKWTKRYLRYADRGSSTTNIYWRYGFTGADNWYSTYARAETVIEDGYNTGWQPKVDGSYYLFYRSIYYWSGIGTAGWRGNVARKKSTPQCPYIIVPDDVQFSWEAYLEPLYVDNDCGASYDGYSGWVENKLKLWDSGGATSSSLVIANTIGGEDETFPCDVAPALSPSNCLSNSVNVTVQEFHWLLKWDFTE